jgi:hypothetical protein
MLVEVMAGVMVDSAVMLVGMLSEDMPLPAMLGVDPLVSVLAVYVVTNLRGPRAAMPASQVAHAIGMAAVTGEVVTGEAVIGMVAVTGEVVTGTRPLDILGMAITAWATAIHTTGLAITVTATVGTTVRTPDTTLTATDIGGRP